MKLNQEWKQQWDAIDVPETELTRIIEKVTAVPEKVTLWERMKSAIKRMKKKFRRRTLYLVGAVVLFLLVGTSIIWSQQQTVEYSYDKAVQEVAPTGEGMMKMEEATAPDSETAVTGDGEATKAKADGTPTAVSGKIVHFYDYSKQTTDFSVDINKIEKLIEESGSYIETSSRSNWSGDLQSAYYKIRIPEEGNGGKETLEKLRGIGDTVDENARTENYSSQYTDNESRIKALETEENALLDMLGKSEKLEDMLKIQERLSTIRAERETLVRSNKGIDNQVDYVTVELSINEVNKVEKKQGSPSVFTRISGNFEEQKLFWTKAAENVLVFVASNVLYFLIGLVLLLVYIYKRKKRKQKKTEKTTAE